MATCRYSDAEKAYLREIIPGRSHKEIAGLFNAKFDDKITVSQLCAFIKNYGLSTGRTGRLEKGHTPWNKGRRGISSEGMKPTQFKPGMRPHNHKPVGTEAITTDGYSKFKIAEPNVWIYTHIFLWERANGPVPKGYCVIFGDGDKRNFDLKNLVLVSRAELYTMNKNGLIGAHVELTKTGVLVADVINKTFERRKKAAR